MSVGSSSLPESLRQDQRLRWLAGDRVLVESYVEQHPELSRNVPALLLLIESEYHLRAELGELPNVDEYVRRFPDLSGQVSRHLAELPQPTRPSGDTRPDSLEARTVSCPFCDAKVDLLAAALGKDMQCAQCGRRLHVLDDTISLRVRPGRRIGAFELVRRLGAGQFGEVWLARDTHLRRDVAIKLPRRADDDPHTAELFLREARAAARLHHPHIVPVHEAGFDDGQVFIVTAYIAGITLRERMNKHSFPPEEAARLCRTLAEALHHAHDSGIIHRDLKPGNVLLDLQGAPHIADFGLAKHSSINELTITTEGLMLGTPAYMPPEQARGAPDQVTPTSDVYSLGVMLYELLTGQRPFDGAIDVLLYRIQTEEPVAPRKLKPNVPRDLETICLKALAKRPADRYASAQDMADDLGRHLKGEPIHARPVGLMERGWRWTRRNWITASMTAACLGLIVLTGASFVANGMFAPRGMANAPKMIRPLELPMPPEPAFHQKVLITTVPEGATVVCYPLDFWTGRPNFHEALPAFESPATIDLVSNTYLIVASKGNLFHEVLRIVPRDPSYLPSDAGPDCWKWDAVDQTVQLHRIQLFPNELAEEELAEYPGCDEFKFHLAPDSADKVIYRVPPFSVEFTELTVGKYERENKFRFAGQPADAPAAGLSWEDAVTYAEKRGLRLLDWVEFECLATNGGEQVHPWGDAPPPADAWATGRSVHLPREDRLTSDPRIVGLHSGVFEWTSTRSKTGYGKDGAGLRYVLRGSARLLEKPELVDQQGAWVSSNQFMRTPYLGLRCGRSPAPRLKEADFITIQKD